MKYALLIYHAEREGERTPDALLPWIEFGKRASAFGTELGAAPLGLSRTARVVSVRGGRPLVTDGPFADTKEQLCGYYLFDCPDQAAALMLASMLPIAPIGHVEVRRVAEFETVAG